MKFIKKIILFLFIFLCPIGTFAKDVQNDALVNKSVIFAPKHIEKDFVKNDTNSPYITTIQNNSHYFRTIPKNGFLGLDGHSSFDLSENGFNFNNTNFSALSDKKSEMLISLLLFQIQPNAP